MRHLTKKEIKVLKYIKKHDSITGLQLRCKFKNCDIEQITYNLLQGYAHLGSSRKEEDEDKFTYSITHDGIYYLESINIFNFEYFLSHLLIPLLVGIIGSFVGAFFQSIF